MEDLAKADFRTIKTFIANNITAERLLVDILQTTASSTNTDKNDPLKSPKGPTRNTPYEIVKNIKNNIRVDSPNINTEEETFGGVPSNKPVKNVA